MKIAWMMAASLTAAALAGAAQAQSPKDFPEVTDGSFVEPNGQKVLKLSLVIPARRKAVWERFTTTEGYKAWATPVAKIDFGLGGMIEGSYDLNARLGDPNNIKNRIVAYSPERLLAIQNVQAPKELPNAREFADIVTIMEFEDAGPAATKVTLTAVGYKPGAAYDTLYKHFGWGNAYSLTKLKESFVKGPIDWKAQAAQQQAAAASAKVTKAP